MAQHDMNIANQGFPAFRADLNSALTAIANNSSGATAPSTTFAYQWWYDTSTNALKMRNADNDAWIEIGTFNQTTDSFTPSGVTSDTISEGNSSVSVVDTGTGYVQVVVDGTEAARIDSSGNLGIGTGSPVAKLDIAGNDPGVQMAVRNWPMLSVGSPTALEFGGVNSGQWQTIKTYTAGSERMRIDSSGHIGVGVTPGSWTYFKAIQSVNSGFLGSSGQTATTFNALYDGSWKYIASDRAVLYNQNDTVGCHKWSTAAYGTAGSTITWNEVMRLDTNGHWLLNTTTDYSGGYSNPIGSVNTTGQNGVIFYNTSAADSGTTIQSSRTNNGIHMIFWQNGGSNGTITTSGSTTSYNTSSDYRLKEDWKPMADSIDRVKALKPINFAWKIDGSRVDGFLAHEVQEIVPEAATGTKDAMRTEEYEVSPAVYEDVVIPAEYDEEGNLIAEERAEQQLVTEAVMGTREVPDYQGIDQSKLVPLLTAALQDAITKIEALEARVDALENA